MALEILTPADFSSFCDTVSAKSFLQSTEMGALLSKRGYTVTYLGLRVNGELQVAGLLYSAPVAGGLYMEINSGPVQTDASHLKEFYAELKKYAKENGAIELIVKPNDDYQAFDKMGNPLKDEKVELIQTMVDLGYQFDGLQTGYPDGEPTWHYVKDLTGIEADKLLSSFNSNGKRLTKRGHTYPITVRPLERHELPIFKDIQDSTSERRGYESKPLDYYEDFYDAFGDKTQFLVATVNLSQYLDELHAHQTELTHTIEQLEKQAADKPEAKKISNNLKKSQDEFAKNTKQMATIEELLKEGYTGDIPLASNLLIYTKQEAVYLFGGFLTKFDFFNAPYLLQEYAMQETLKRGISLYNFLGIQGIFDGSDGVLRFKQNFNGSIVRKMGTFRYYPKPLKYKAIYLVKKLLGRL